ncbi:MAG: plastocyanin/azurin family copper-binding protein, partial [Phycisphaerae bacterium]|nr:plastocyanin/azurin family copper-binding protein [Phycisphaerae bacterium]
FPILNEYPRDNRLTVQESLGRTGADELVSRRINAVPGLRFEPAQIRVPPGRRVALTFTNADINMQHNLVVVRPERLKPIGEASELMAADPRAIARHYVPDDSGVLALSPVLNPGGQYTIYFNAPQKSGTYRIVCTFPGHWRVMQGTMVVE